MRKIYILLIFLFLIQNLFAQDTIRIYFDKNWEKIKHGENAMYSRKVFKKGDLWYVKDYYLNGQLQMEGSFNNKKCTERSGEFIYYTENGNIDHKGIFLNNNYEGTWIWYHTNDKKSSEELYSNGKRIKAEYWDTNGMKVDSAEGEHKASFNGSEQGFRKYVESNLIYSKAAQKAGKEGLVLVSFVIETDGSLTNAVVIKSAGHLLDEEALRVIRSSPKWEPAKLHNRLVRIQYTFPLTFILK